MLIVDHLVLDILYKMHWIWQVLKCDTIFIILDFIM